MKNRVHELRAVQHNSTYHFPLLQIHRQETREWFLLLFLLNERRDLSRKRQLLVTGTRDPNCVFAEYEIAHDERFVGRFPIATRSCCSRKAI